MNLENFIEAACCRRPAAPLNCTFKPLLTIRNLRVEFGPEERPFRAVDDVSLEAGAGETMCLVGESGSGKTVTALSIARLVPSPPARYSRGEVLLNGQDVLKMSSTELRQIRGGMVSYVFQEPAASLNPAFRVGAQIKESLKLHRPDVATDEEVVRLLKLVGIAAPELRRRSYPHELSGGMQQRVMIAIALASQPKLLVADEPTTALDVTIQAQIIDLVKRLRDKIGMAIIWISHDLGVVAGLASTVQVMYAGTIVERGPVNEIFNDTRHPYTLGLKGALPRVDRRGERLVSIEGSPPDMRNPPVGCPFAARCAFRIERCLTERPPLLPVADGHPEHLAACFYDLRERIASLA